MARKIKSPRTRKRKLDIEILVSVLRVFRVEDLEKLAQELDGLIRGGRKPN